MKNLVKENLNESKLEIESDLNFIQKIVDILNKSGLNAKFHNDNSLIIKGKSYDEFIKFKYNN